MDLHGERRRSYIRIEHKRLWREDVKLSSNKSSDYFRPPMLKIVKVILLLKTRW